MTTLKSLRSVVLGGGALGLLLMGSVAAQSNKSVLVEGLQLPYKLLLTPGGNLLVSEAGGAPNTGRISMVSRSGNRTSLLEGLPSGPSNPELTPIGPTGIVLRERTLYVAIGEGDAVRNGPTQGSLVLNPAGVSSPLFASVLRFQFDEDPDRIVSPFVMTMAMQGMLADGHEEPLENQQGRRVLVQLLTKFQLLNSDARTVYRHSDPFGLAMGPGSTDPLYLVDAGQNTLVEINGSTGRWHVRSRFAPIPNPTRVGPPLIDYVPTAALVFGDEVLVTNLSGFPFVPGQAAVRTVNPRTGVAGLWISGLASAIDIGMRSRPQGDQFFVLSFSGNMGATPALPGELLQYDSPTGRSIATFVTPTGMVVDSASGEVFVCELGPGRITRVTVQ